LVVLPVVRIRWTWMVHLLWWLQRPMGLRWIFVSAHCSVQSRKRLNWKFVNFNMTLKVFNQEQRFPVFLLWRTIWYQKVNVNLKKKLLAYLFYLKIPQFEHLKSCKSHNLWMKMWNLKTSIIKSQNIDLIWAQFFKTLKLNERLKAYKIVPSFLLSSVYIKFWYLTNRSCRLSFSGFDKS